MAKRSRVNGLHYWLDVMSRRTLLNKGQHESIHDAMAFEWTRFHFNGRSEKDQAAIIDVVSQASKKGGWQAYRLLRRRKKLPLYRGGRGSDITFVSLKPHHKEEHFTREVDRTWTRIEILETEMAIGKMKNSDREAVRWISKGDALRLENIRPEALKAKVAIDENSGK